ncbi:MAG: chorismate-binding protein, partial [Psychroflexus sp.]
FNSENTEVSNVNQQEYQNLVENCIQQIENKKFIKAVLSRCIDLDYEMKDLGLIFLRLLKKYPDAMTYVWFHPKVGLWLGASPEILANLKRNKLETMALAGTRSVNDSKDWTEKEKDEQQIVVDEIVNSLKHNTSDILISERETIQAGDLLHLRTDVSTFIDRTKFDDILKSLHPTPAVCGLPKDSAYYYLLNHEKYDRQFYTGYFGEINMKNEIKRSEKARNQENQAYAAVLASTELFVNLRCMSFQNDQMKIYVGGGITKDSQAEAEWEETVHKSQTMLKVL